MLWDTNKYNKDNMKNEQLCLPWHHLQVDGFSHKLEPEMGHPENFTNLHLLDRIIIYGKFKS